MTFSEELTYITKGKCLYRVNLKNFTTIGIGGPAKYFVYIDSLLQIKELINLCNKKRVKYVVLGGGSNTLFSDKGFDGLVINTKRFSSIITTDDGIVVTAGVSVKNLLDFCVEKSLFGVEFLSGIPASLGGVIACNAGAFGKSISDVVKEVKTLKGEKLLVYNKEDCKFNYRSSRFLTSKEVIISAKLNLLSEDAKNVKENILNNKRLRALQPKGKTFGSVFKNGKNYFAGELIERAGLKGFQIGGAKISDKHANFIINENNATAKEVVCLIEKIKEEVLDKFGVELLPEVKLIGEF